MKDKRYSSDWMAIATNKKQAVGWVCERCGVQCLRPGEGRNLSWDIHEKKRRELQVHHCDHNPANNAPENLMAVCSICHLDYHRGGRGSITPGQLEMALDLPNHRKGRPEFKIP